MARISKFLMGFAVLGLALFSFASVAVFAQEIAAEVTQVLVDPDSTGTTVVIPTGSWIEQSAEFLSSTGFLVIWGGILWLLNRFSPPLVALLKTAQVEQLLKRGIDYAINAVVGASKDHKLSIDVGNKVVAEAVNYIVAQAPGKLIDWLGGTDAIKRMVFARLNLEENASAETASVYVPEAPAT